MKQLRSRFRPVYYVCVVHKYIVLFLQQTACDGYIRTISHTSTGEALFSLLCIWERCMATDGDYTRNTVKALCDWSRGLLSWAARLCDSLQHGRLFMVRLSMLRKGKRFSTREQVLSHIPLFIGLCPVKTGARDISWHSPTMALIFIEVQSKCVQTGGFTTCWAHTCQHESNHSESGVVTWWLGQQNKHLWRKHHLKTGNTTKAKDQVALHCYRLRSTKK